MIIFLFSWQAKNKYDRIDSDMTYVSLSSVSTHQDLCKLLLSKGETIGTMFLIIMVLEIVFVCRHCVYSFAQICMPGGEGVRHFVSF